MTNALVLDLAVLIGIGIAVVRGWHHRSIREFFSLLGLGVGLLLTPVLTGPLADLLEGMGWVDVNIARAISAGVVLGIPALVGAIFGVRTARAVTPSGPKGLDGAGGSMFALVRAIVITSLILYAAASVSTDDASATSFGKAIDDSVGGQLMAQPDSTFTIIYDGLVKRSADLQALALWARQRSGFREQVPGDRLDLAATNERLDVAGRAERQMLELLNTERVDRDLEPLAWCADCAAVARDHSKDMYRLGYFSHIDSAGDDPFDRMASADINYGAAGENLSIAPTVPRAHEGLMASTDHRENILRGLFDEVGIGCYEGPYGLMCTQVFRALAI